MARNATGARGEFGVLIVSEQKSLGRESFGVGAVIKELAQAGVEVWSYMDQRSLTPRNAMDKAMSSLRSFGDEAHREDTSRRNHEGAASKHSRGHVVGGRVFGYRNVDVCDGLDEHGRPRRMYVDREVVPEQAATVVRVFEMFADGMGLKAIAKRLKVENVEGPRPFVRKDGSGLAPFGWAPSTVGAILKREVYRGVYVWNRSKKRDSWGEKKQRPRPESEWKRIEKPEWRIVSDDLWNAVAARRKEVAESCAAMRMSDGKLSGRLPKGAVTNLLAGLCKCGVCGGGLVVETYKHSKNKPRVPHYVCNRRRASGGCENTLRIALDDMHEAVLCAIEEHALTPEAVEAVVAATQRDVSASAARSLERELKVLEKRIERLTDAIADGGDLASLVGKLKEMEQRRDAIRAEQAAAQPVPMPPRAEIEDRLAEWRRLLRASVATGRAVLDKVLVDRIVFTPAGTDVRRRKDGTEYVKPLGYEFECPTRYDRLFSGLVIPKAAWAATIPGAGVIGPEHVYYRAEDGGVDFGEVLRRAMVDREINRTRVASPTGFATLPPSWLSPHCAGLSCVARRSSGID